MDHLTYYESFNPIKWVGSKISKLKISQICKKYGITGWSLREDGLVDVDGNVHISNKKLTKIPMRFGVVTGNFLCHDNELSTLSGSPYEVGGNFWCGRNMLKTIYGGPKYVGGHYFCYHNSMISLVGAPGEIGGEFFCNYNKLTTLVGGPKVVGGNFDCSYNLLSSLGGLPKISKSLDCRNNNIIDINSNIDLMVMYCYGNPIFNIYSIFDSTTLFLKSLDWDYISGNKIIKHRFRDALSELAPGHLLEHFNPLPHLSDDEIEHLSRKGEVDDVIDWSKFPDLEGYEYI